MSALVLLRQQPEDAALSPELRYLASFRLAEARKVFDTVADVLWRPADRGSEAPETAGGLAARGAAVLILGSANVHLGSRSLQAMKAALDAGAAAVAPAALASVPLDEPVHTLRGFEQVERRVLAAAVPGTRQAGPRPRSHLPVALFSSSWLADRLGDVALADLLADRDLLAARGLADEIVSAGLFHEFIDYYGEARDDVLPYLPPHVADVLEVGCGRGHTGAFLQERLGCRVTGVELNPEVARQAAERLHRVIVGDVLTATIDGRFDAVVATELFEHLTWPETFLAKVGTLLRPGGRLVMSVPNVGHHAVVEDLLAGRWDYLPIGLLCYTHFRFFTRATLASWLERAGFGSYRIVAQTGELPERFRELSERFEIDAESLRTTGFYVVVEVEPE